MSKQYKGIDISEWQGVIDFSQVKSQVDFIILRAGYGKEIYQKDKQFERNYTECKKYGIPVGCYWYSYANSVENAKKEAYTLLEVIKNKQFEYPIYFDIEDKSIKGLDRQTLTDITKTFCSIIEQAGYYVGIYANVDWFDNILYKDQLKAYDKWLAHWTSKPKYNNDFGGLWQHSDSGKIYGVSGNVDLDISYRDYPTIIKNKKLNGYGKIIKVGDLVRIKNNAKSYRGVSLASFVYNNRYVVMEVNNDRAIIGIEGEITTDINVNDLIII